MIYIKTIDDSAVIDVCIYGFFCSIVKQANYAYITLESVPGTNQY